MFSNSCSSSCVSLWLAFLQCPTIQTQPENVLWHSQAYPGTLDIRSAFNQYSQDASAFVKGSKSMTPAAISMKMRPSKWWSQLCSLRAVQGTWETSSHHLTSWNLNSKPAGLVNSCVTLKYKSSGKPWNAKWNRWEHAFNSFYICIIISLWWW